MPDEISTVPKKIIANKKNSREIRPINNKTRENRINFLWYYLIRDQMS